MCVSCRRLTILFPVASHISPHSDRTHLYKTNMPHSNSAVTGNQKDAKSGAVVDAKRGVNPASGAVTGDRNEAKSGAVVDANRVADDRNDALKRGGAVDDISSGVSIR